MNIDCIDYVTGIGNLHMHNTVIPVTDTDLATGEGRRKSVDLALQTSVLGVKTLHSTAEVSDNMTKASV